MKPVNQTIVHKRRGNCMQAAVASIYELPLEKVVNFIEHGYKWHDVWLDFHKKLGYTWWFYSVWPEDERRDLEAVLKDTLLINDSIYAVVKSRTFEGASHAVVINANGIIIHDPNPNKAWQGVNVLDLPSEYFEGWYRPEVS